MKTETIRKAYELARERYAEIGIDTDKVLERMDNFHLSLHCWQADDVVGFVHATSRSSVPTSLRLSPLSPAHTVSTSMPSTAISRVSSWTVTRLP